MALLVRQHEARDLDSRRTVEARIGYYSSAQQILLIGEGDFSFASSLASAFGSAVNIMAISLDSFDEVLKKYEWASSNLSNLYHRGAFVQHNIDAKTMAEHPRIKCFRFDRIVWNLPHAGFFGMAETMEPVIEQHRALLKSFFLNASKLLDYDGEVHVSHQAHGPYKKWDVEKLAQLGGLTLRQSSPFHPSFYPGYCNRRGVGSCASDTFAMGYALTYKFGQSQVIQNVACPVPKHGGRFPALDESVKATRQSCHQVAESRSSTGLKLPESFPRDENHSRQQHAAICQSLRRQGKQPELLAHQPPDIFNVRLQRESLCQSSNNLGQNILNLCGMRVENPSRLQHEAFCQSSNNVGQNILNLYGMRVENPSRLQHEALCQSSNNVGQNILNLSGMRVENPSRLQHEALCWSSNNPQSLNNLGQIILDLSEMRIGNPSRLQHEALCRSSNNVGQNILNLSGVRVANHSRLQHEAMRQSSNNVGQNILNFSGMRVENPSRLQHAALCQSENFLGHNILNLSGMRVENPSRLQHAALCQSGNFLGHNILNLSGMRVENPSSNNVGQNILNFSGMRVENSSMCQSSNNLSQNILNFSGMRVENSSMCQSSNNLSQNILNFSGMRVARESIQAQSSNNVG